MNLLNSFLAINSRRKLRLSLGQPYNPVYDQIFWAGVMCICELVGPEQRKGLRLYIFVSET